VIEPPVKRRRRSGLEDLLGDVFATNVTVPPSIPAVVRIQREMDKYRCTPDAPLGSSPFSWWKHHEVEFPLLSNIARSVLHIPATSVPSERVFSAAGDIVTATRNCLSSEIVDVLVFLKQNL